jgi:hypothetical protein
MTGYANFFSYCSKVILLASLAALTSCSAMRDRSFAFPTYESVKAHLLAHQEELQKAAEAWNSIDTVEGQSQSDVDLFCYFEEGSYRWRSRLIRKDGAGFLVDEKRPAMTFQEAATLAGTTVSTLNEWIEKSRALDVRCFSIDRKSKLPLGPNRTTRLR